MSSVGMGGGGAAPIQPGQPSGVPKEKDVKSANAGKLNKGAAAQTGPKAKSSQQIAKDLIRENPDRKIFQINFALISKGKTEISEKEFNTLKADVKKENEALKAEDQKESSNLPIINVLSMLKNDEILRLVPNDKKNQADEVLSHLHNKTKDESIKILKDLGFLEEDKNFLEEDENNEILDLVKGDRLEKNNAENLIIQLRKEGDSKDQIIAFLRDQGMIK